MPKNYWKEEDIKTLIDNYDKLGVKGCSKLLNMSDNRIRRKAELIGIKSSLAKKEWSQKDIDFLINNYTKLGSSKCAEIIKRSPNSIRKKA